MLIKLLHSLYMHAISSSLKIYLNREGNEIRSIYLLKNGNRDTEFIPTYIEITKKWYYSIVWRADRQTPLLL